MTGEALERLVRGAMASGAMYLIDHAGHIDPSSSMDEAFGDFPTLWIRTRTDLVSDMVAEVKTNG